MIRFQRPSRQTATQNLSGLMSLLNRFSPVDNKTPHLMTKPIADDGFCEKLPAIQFVTPCRGLFV